MATSITLILRSDHLWHVEQSPAIYSASPSAEPKTLRLRGRLRAKPVWGYFTATGTLIHEQRLVSPLLVSMWVGGVGLGGGLTGQNEPVVFFTVWEGENWGIKWRETKVEAVDKVPPPFFLNAVNNLVNFYILRLLWEESGAGRAVSAFTTEEQKQMSWTWEGTGFSIPLDHLY